MRTKRLAVRKRVTSTIGSILDGHDERLYMRFMSFSIGINRMIATMPKVVNIFELSMEDGIFIQLPDMSKFWIPHIPPSRYQAIHADVTNQYKISTPSRYEHDKQPYASARGSLMTVI